MQCLRAYQAAHVRAAEGKRIGHGSDEVQVEVGDKCSAGEAGTAGKAGEGLLQDRQRDLPAQAVVGEAARRLTSLSAQRIGRAEGREIRFRVDELLQETIGENIQLIEIHLAP